MVAGLERVTTGDIWIDRSVSPKWSRKIAGLRWCFRTSALSAYERRRKHGVGAENSRMGKQQIAERVKEAARILELEACSNVARVSYPAVSVSVWRWPRDCARSGGVPV